MFAYRGRYRNCSGARQEIFSQAAAALLFARENIRQCMDFVIIHVDYNEVVYTFRTLCEEEGLNVLLLKKISEE